ncbi:EamA-like transporter family protein [Salinihabitans flavidus]|uniref:EamA-like transporter family protein n=1 Tax=Salinihabitans flavidus TaxID=569882 RepID=A0A1H8LKN3_9RHOB|nr:DMT family transporter [Salinihabitans flavidus]SEO05711.1 EamA-like transporter family protein [Salinihabitans flavidus]
MDTHLKGLLITAAGVLFVVPDSLFARLIEADPIVIGFWRGVVAGVLIMVWVLITQGVSPFRAVLRTGWNGAVYIAVMGMTGVLFILAVSMTSVANVVFIIATMPVFAAIYSRIILGETISRRMVLTMIAVAAGLAIIAYGSGETASAHWSGDLVALCVAALFAAGLTAVRRVRHVPMVAAAPIGYIGASLLIWPFIDPFSVPTPQVWMVLAHGAFIAASSALLALGPRYITSAEVALFILLESVLAPLLAWAVIAEDPGIWAIVGGAVVIGALAVSNIVALMRRRRRLPGAT